MEALSNRDPQSEILKILNDACLQRVFQFLSLRDLSNTADSCKKFKQNATEIFKSKFTDLNILELIKGEKNYHDEWFMVRWQAEEFLEHAEQLLRNFGQYIETLDLTGHGEKGGINENELLILVKTHCSSLKVLTLRNIGGSDDFNSIELLPMFNGLEKLSVISTDVCNSFVAILADCHELKHLNVTHVPATMWVNHKFPKLETLVISNNWAWDYTEVESFVQHHENLRTLLYDDFDIFHDFFPVLAKASHRLETFHCNVTVIVDDEDDDQHELENNVLQLSKLKSMRNFTFSCDASTMNLLIDAFDKEDTPIENFEILNCKIDHELIVGLSKLKWLETLKLTRCIMNKETFVEVNESLNRLNRVTIKDVNVLDLNGHNLPLANNVCVVKSPKKRTSKEIIQDRDPSNILNALNDYHLIAIFEYLPLPDLCTVADVCKTFKHNAQTAFQLHHSHFNTEKITKTVDGIHTGMQMAEKLFRNFGHLIQKLCVNGHCLKNDKERESIMYLANKYCPETGFKTLALDGIRINGEMRWILPLFQMFFHTGILELSACYLSENFGKFLSCCQIPQILVHEFRGSDEWMNHQFGYLRSMILYNMWQPASRMKKFIKLNGHLQLLAIEHVDLPSQIFRMVAKHMYGLQALYFSGRCPQDRRVPKNVLHLAKLKNLTRLKLNCNSFPLGPLIDELTKASSHLTELSINFGTVDMQLLEKLSNLKSSLTALSLRRVKMNKVSLIDIVMKIPDLDDLQIDIQGIGVKDIIKMLPLAQKLTKLSIGSSRSDVKIDTVNYQSILLIVQSRLKVKSLHIHITSEDSRVFVPQHLLQENKYWLKIENEIFEDLRSVMSDSDSEIEDEEASGGEETSGDEESSGDEEPNGDEEPSGDEQSSGDEESGGDSSD